MANLNKVMMIGRLTFDPEHRAFSNGGAVTKIRFVTNNRKKDPQSGEWVDDPMYIDIEFFNRGEQGKLADRARDLLRKGSQIFVEGHLILDKWNDKETNKERSKHKIVGDNFQLLERRENSGDSSEYSDGESAPAPRAKTSTNNGSPSRSNGRSSNKPTTRPAPVDDNEPTDDIPF